MSTVDLVAALWLGLAIGNVSYLFSQAMIFKPLRNWTETKSFDSRLWGLVWEILRCPYCQSFYWAAGATALYQPWVVNYWRPLDFLVTMFVMIDIAMLAVFVIRKALAKVSV